MLCFLRRKQNSLCRGLVLAHRPFVVGIGTDVELCSTLLAPRQCLSKFSVALAQSQC